LSERGAGQRLPQLRVRLLYRLGEDLQLFERGRGRLHRVAGGVHVGIAELHHLLQPASRLVALEIGDGLLVVPLGVCGRHREILAVMGKRGFGPALLNDGDCFLERLAVALLVLDRRAIGATERLVLARLIAAADTAIDPPAADHVQRGDLLGEPHRVVPDDDVGGLAEPDALGVGRDAHLHHERIWAHLRTLRLEMVLGEPERLKPELFGENSPGAPGSPASPVPRGGPAAANRH